MDRPLVQVCHIIHGSVFLSDLDDLAARNLYLDNKGVRLPGRIFVTFFMTKRKIDTRKCDRSTVGRPDRYGLIGIYGGIQQDFAAARGGINQFIPSEHRTIFTLCSPILLD